MTAQNGPPERARTVEIVVKIMFAALLIAAAAVFLEIADQIWLNEPIPWDMPIMRTVDSWSSPLLDVVFRAITLTGGELIAIPVIAASVWLWRRGRRRGAILIVISIVITSALNIGLKMLFGRARPSLVEATAFAANFSFPSGHTTAAAAFYGLLAVLLWRAGRYGLATLSLLWVPLVGLSRVYLDVHYPSDVLASLALGVVWLISLFVVASIYLPERT